MVRYTIQRLFAMVPVLLIVSMIVFLLVHLTPGNPAYLILGEDSSKESIAQLEEQLGLNKPFLLQYFDWLKNVLTGDLGTSIYSSEPVLELIINRFGPTFSLMALSMMLAIGLAVPLAVFVVWRRSARLDSFFVTGSLLGVSIPEFWLAMILVLGFGVFWPIFPTSGYVSFSDGVGPWLYHLLLPAIVLATVEIGLIARMLRDSMLEVIHEDYVQTARAKGLRESLLIVRHILFNALIPTTTVVGVMVAGLLGGAVIIETLFTIPGIGQLLIDSIHRRDYPVIQGVVLWIAGIYVIVNLLIDLLYTFLDPRIRYD